MKRLLTAASLSLLSLIFAGVGSADARGNCHNFLTSAGTGAWIKTASGGYVHDGSTVCDLTIGFEAGSAELTAAGTKTLLDNLDIIRYSGAAGFSDIGFASVEGEEEDNQTLSDERAEAVQQFLVDNGVDMDLIYPVFGLGETEDFGADHESNRVVILSFNG